ncbi:MAG TPA: CoB--CoM heterodisulfide reductase iron-sulfur subunit B family protein [Myxococcota bacterium]|nr:CoB--CoM heterodisulfide reductase iron-sulfur subunit B family protein [Myxococcota bacterium]HRY95870.1 CoB--CoM heterodisulfide reductase iron-sulfur subunit B family protein [Myxococcota bacterium]HSA22381.1 CoB--CoM heterodisulfide reductase iron-sulfur subunit B family protein [Myxococcota bacterium]
MKKYLYYPGCSQKATSRAYEEALLAIAADLGLELQEVEDWNCCGTTPVMAVNKVLALSLAARNLALAEAQGQGELTELVTPCPSCWLALHKAQHALADDEEIAGKVRASLEAGGYSYKGTIRPRHLLEVLVNEVGVEAIQQKAGKPLQGLKVAPYYGCQVLRPYAQGDDAEHPQNLEKIIRATGAEVAEFPLQSACCGGTLVATRPEVGYQMSADILRAIERSGANLVVTPCNLCQATLEIVQRKTPKFLGHKTKLPILAVTQLIGLAMGKSVKELGLQRSLNAKRCLRTMGRETAA